MAWASARSGGSLNDELLGHHGTDMLSGGAGQDILWGSIDCGPGIDTARIRTTGAFKTKNCELIRHFCAYGENSAGDCLSPTGKPVQTARRR